MTHFEEIVVDGSYLNCFVAMDEPPPRVPWLTITPVRPAPIEEVPEASCSAAEPVASCSGVAPKRPGIKLKPMPKNNKEPKRCIFFLFRVSVPKDSHKILGKHFYYNPSLGIYGENLHPL